MPPYRPVVSDYQFVLQPTGEPASVFAVRRDRAGTWTGTRAGSWTRAGAGLFVLSGSRWTGARPGAGLGARLGPGGGSVGGPAPSRGLLLRGATHGPGAAPGAVAAPGTTPWARVAAGAALAVSVGRKRSSFYLFSAQPSWLYLFSWIFNDCF